MSVSHLSPTSVQSFPASDRLPNLLIIGAMKSSTTTLYERLSVHPQIWFSADKEPHYFTGSEYGTPEGWQSYCQQFAAAPADVRWIAEASTGYSKFPRLGPTAERIHDQLGRPAMIYVLRDPVARIVSNFRHNHATGIYRADMTLAKSLELDPIVVCSSRYESQIRAYESVFGPDCLYLIIAEELHARPQAVLARLADWLEIETCPAWEDSLPESNQWQDIGRTLRLQRWIPKSWYQVLKRATPSLWRNRLKSLVPGASAPPVSEQEPSEAWSRIADDLHRLRERLGDRIALWPSVQRFETRAAL